jgi:hypothetical protein
LSDEEMNESYDVVSKKVNDEIEKLTDDLTFGNLANIDKKLKLPRGTSFEMSGLSDYFNFYLDT